MYVEAYYLEVDLIVTEQFGRIRYACNNVSSKISGLEPMLGMTKAIITSDNRTYARSFIVTESKN